MAEYAELSDPRAVVDALDEFDRLGRAEFLKRYGFGESDKYVLLADSREYDSKAIVGVAYGFQYPDHGPLKASEFSGGKATVVRLLNSLGFTVVERRSGGDGRNPNWTYDEVILAMDLYLRSGLCHKNHPEVIELSELLNSLPIHGVRTASMNFRNPSGVALKMANLASLDPNYSGKGMASASQTDRAVWDRFCGDHLELSRLASLIRAGASGDDPILNEQVDDEESVIEGRVVFRKHRSVERNQKIVQKKRAQLENSVNGIRCEVCGFDFEEKYGPRGIGYIEVHHLVPLSLLGQTKTTTEDLAGLCANCHRMIHRGEPWLTLDQLKESIDRETKGSD